MSGKTYIEASKTLGNIVRRERNRLGLTQQELGEELGYAGKDASIRSIYRIEAGQQGLTHDKASDMCRIFSCSMDYLAGKSNKRSSFGPVTNAVSRQLERDSMKENNKPSSSRQLLPLFEKMQAENVDILLKFASAQGWEKIGEIGVVQYKGRKTRKFTQWVCKSESDVPDNMIFTPQFYVFDARDGQHVIACKDFERLASQIRTYIETRLMQLERPIPQLGDFYGTDDPYVYPSQLLAIFNEGNPDKADSK